MWWVWVIGAAWLLLGAAIALLIGRSIVYADPKSADRAADSPEAPGPAPDRPPLTLLPKPPAAPPAAAPPRAAGRETPTVPGLPSARPPVGRPPVPRAKRPRPPRRSSGA
jgi:hypothetical protein